MKKALLLLVLVFATAHLIADGIITTIAGASTVDNVLATSTLLNYASGVAADDVGNIYISDTGNQRVRRVDGGTHIITTVAGTGVAGYGGDNGYASEAQLNNPEGLSFVNNGTNSLLYVADTGNHRIRLINLSTGIITTVAGNGVATYNGDGGLGIQSSLYSPADVCADNSGDIYIADTGNNRVREVLASTYSITTVAGTGIPNGTLGDGLTAGAASLDAPSAVFVSSAANILYIADNEHYRIRSVSLTTGVISTLAGTGTSGYSSSFAVATSSDISNVYGLSVTNGYLFFADSNNQLIRFVYLGGWPLYLSDWFGSEGNPGFAGDGNVNSAGVEVNNPRALNVDSNYNVIFSDYSNNCVRERYNSSPFDTTTVAGSGIQSGVPGVNVVMNDPTQVIAGAGNSFLVAETGAIRVRSLNFSNGIITTFAGTGNSNYSGDGAAANKATFYGVHAIARNAATGNVYVADNNSQIVASYTNFCLPPPFSFCIPIITGFYTIGNSRLRVINSAGNITTVAGIGQLNDEASTVPAFGNALGLINGLAISGTNLYLSDNFFQVVRVMNLSTGMISPFAGLSGTAGYAGDGSIVGMLTNFNNPQGLATDSKGDVLIADTGNNVVREVSASSLSITTICGLGPLHPGYSGDGGLATAASLFSPTGVWVDTIGNIFIADTGNSRIRRIDASSHIINTVSGNGFQGFSGDGGPALASNLNQPTGIYVDPQNDLYIADAGNSRVREVSYAVTPAPTPVVSGTGKAVAYPSPASSQVCFSYIAGAAGAVEIDVYNEAFQLVAKFNDNVGSGAVLTCANVSGLASGVYLYKVNAPGSTISPNKFKVIH